MSKFHSIDQILSFFAKWSLDINFLFQRDATTSKTEEDDYSEEDDEDYSYDEESEYSEEDYDNYDEVKNVFYIIFPTKISIWFDTCLDIFSSNFT